MTDRATPWALPHRDEQRAQGLTALQTVTDEAKAAEREERWHAARLFRRTFRRPRSWLDCLGLTDVPAAPDGWCTCPRPRDALTIPDTSVRPPTP